MIGVKREEHFVISTNIPELNGTNSKVEIWWDEARITYYFKYTFFTSNLRLAGKPEILKRRATQYETYSTAFLLVYPLTFHSHNKGLLRSDKGNGIGLPLRVFQRKENGTHN
ncbi:hypothetical protein AVEN_251037-1 [Araneus ventricosus]|uniref:Uncharacterized protein n=1 Tax=Araneus ventricosus TaxID=182803 RepID=A0A4Y2DJX5_ARAVE|nr:hypothetical protein AVEN_251037-1 [Araneus ventricosus]